MELKISRDYSKMPGGRYRKDGSYSGEDFREKHLIPLYERAKESGEILIVNFDGGYGYATSFLEEAFGGLVRSLGDRSILSHLEFVSDDDSNTIVKVIAYIKGAIGDL